MFVGRDHLRSILPILTFQSVVVLLKQVRIPFIAIGTNTHMCEEIIVLNVSMRRMAQVLKYGIALLNNDFGQLQA